MDLIKLLIKVVIFFITEGISHPSEKQKYLQLRGSRLSNPETQHSFIHSLGKKISRYVGLSRTGTVPSRSLVKCWSMEFS